MHLHTDTPAAAAAALSPEKQAILDQFISSPLAAAMIDLMTAAPRMSAEAAGRQSLDRWAGMAAKTSRHAHQDEATKAYVSGLSALTYQRLTA